MPSVSGVWLARANNRGADGPAASLMLKREMPEPVPRRLSRE